jgi:type IV secretory pathway VirB6-like protein
MEATCSEHAILSFIRIIRIIFSMIEVIAPIVFMVSLAYLFFTIVIGDDTKKMNETKFKIKNALVATIVVFFLPVFIEIVFIALGQRFEVSACWKEAGHPIFSTLSSDYKPEPQKESQSNSFIINPEDYKDKGTDENPNGKYSIFKNWFNNEDEDEE